MDFDFTVPTGSTYPTQRDVVTALREFIVVRGAPPGTVFPVTVLAERFGVSPIPVREALKTLVGEGLLTHVPHRGYLVERLRWEDFVDRSRVLALLEQEAARTAMTAADDADRAALAALFDQLTEAHAVRDPQRYREAGVGFHSALVSATRRRGLIATFFQVARSLSAYAQVGSDAVEPLERTYRDQAAIWRAFSDGDTEGLIEALAAYAETRIAVVEPFRDDPAYFGD
ncbi:MAG: GntR family transcriptional regulator [Nocardioides sp.]|uniref:GntR family transcriptional regulator n=1 Tax=Nocardioides sp. TaxID=35761 RepID=UPI0039E64546